MLFQIDTGILFLVCLFLLCLLVLFTAIRRIRGTISDANTIRQDAAALIKGELLGSEKKKYINKMKKQGRGLRFKLSFYTIVLVFVVQLMVWLPLHQIMPWNQMQERDILIISLFVALAAQAIGVIGAFVLSAYIIRPISALVSHVEKIRDAEDLTKLKDLNIKFKSRDELAILADTINEMTGKLVKAAVAASDLSIAKEIQKKFLPLNFDIFGNKLSSGAEDTKYLSIFCHYEGAEGVSGDYVDYMDLDGRYYAIIKCDVSGKGIPAAFIMIQVATMFINHFKHWKYSDKAMQIEELVYEMNEFIEALAFKGRFAAFTLCLYDSETGTARFCNAGDNIVRIFDASEKKLKTLALPPSPAIGVLTNLQVESKGGYKTKTLMLDHGDILMLYTDGIEESKRKFRNTNFEDIICTFGELNKPHGNHIVGQGNEELGNERVIEIINSVMNREVYSLQKWHNPEGEDKVLKFDFESTGGSVEELIMALVSVEKMFRCYKKTSFSEDDRVLVDKAIDAFLIKHFIQYRDYCYYKQENSSDLANMYYTHVKEDEQDDDITIMGIMRK